MLAGYTIHTVVALAHAGLIPLEHQQAVQQAFQQIAPLLSATPDTLTALMDKSLPTMIGLGGNSLPTLKPGPAFRYLSQWADGEVFSLSLGCSCLSYSIGSFPIHSMGGLCGSSYPWLGAAFRYPIS